MDIGHGDKFGPATIAAKTRIKAERIVQGYDMNHFAAMLGISRKKLEDIEATRNYGCFLDLEMMKHGHTNWLPNHVLPCTGSQAVTH